MRGMGAGGRRGGWVDIEAGALVALGGSGGLVGPALPGGRMRGCGASSGGGGGSLVTTRKGSERTAMKG